VGFGGGDSNLYSYVSAPPSNDSDNRADPTFRKELDQWNAGRSRLIIDLTVVTRWDEKAWSPTGESSQLQKL
jgi:hypothetical protein